ASAGRRLASAATRAFSVAFASKLSPVSSGSANSSVAAPTTSMPNGRSGSSISASFPLLWVAITKRCSRKGRLSGKAERLLLVDEQLADALARQRQQPQEIGLGEDGFLRRRLHLDEIAAASKHEIGVGIGRGILGVVEVEHGNAAGDTAGHRRHRI